MASGRSPRWLRILHKVPFLFKICPGGNYHWRFDLYCTCRWSEHEGDWRGGVYCFKHKQETPCLNKWLDTS